MVNEGDHLGHIIPHLRGFVKLKPKVTQPQTPNEVQTRDLFQTPNYAVDLLVPFIPDNINDIWEPAAGEGKIVRRLEQHGFGVFSSDIRFNPDWIDMSLDFLSAPVHEDRILEVSAIITNPPFSLKRNFYEKCKEYKIPFALLIPADYSGWIINAIRNDGCEKIIPTRRIDYITPTGKNGKSSTSQFHSMWLTYGFNIGRTETFVELSLEDKRNI